MSQFTTGGFDLLSDEWRISALCATHEDPNLWFPEGRGASFRDAERRALAVRAVCPVRVECRAEVDRIPIQHAWGVWAGESYRDPRIARTARAHGNTPGHPTPDSD